MTLHDSFVKHTANTLGHSPDIIEKVISNQWKQGKAATLYGSIIEFTGLGRLQVRMNKVEEKKIQFNHFYNAAKKTLDGYTEADERWYASYKTVKGLEKDLEFLDMKKGNQTKKKKHEDRATEDTGRD